MESKNQEIMKKSSGSVSEDAVHHQRDPNGNPLEEAVQEETRKPKTKAKPAPGDDLKELKKHIWEWRFGFLQFVPLNKIEDAMKDNLSLRRWLHAYQDDALNAAFRILSNLKWRETNQVDKILDEGYLDKHFTDFPIYFGSVDNAGRPVIYIPLHMWRTEKIHELHRSGKWLKYVISFFEQSMKECLKAEVSSRVALRFSVIINADGVSAFKLMKQKALWRFSLFTKIWTKRYPGTLLRCIVINVASPLDRNSFQFILCRKSIFKVHFLLQIYLKTEYFMWITLLRSWTQPDQLPVECGGWKLISEDVVDTKSLPLARF